MWVLEAIPEQARRARVELCWCNYGLHNLFIGHLGVPSPEWAIALLLMTLSGIRYTVVKQASYE